MRKGVNAFIKYILRKAVSMDPVYYIIGNNAIHSQFLGALE